MIRVNIRNEQGEIGWSAFYNTLSEADRWLEREIENRSFGEIFTVEKLDIGFDLKLEEIRSTRNQLLAACDFTQLPDSPLSDEKKMEWRNYRRALRDIPQTMDQNGEVVWPTKPQ